MDAKNSQRRGISLIETVIVVAVFTTLVSLAVINLLNVRVTSSGNSSLYAFISDVKSQQIKAMTGDTGGRSSTDNYGIYIEPTKYTFFHGLNYSSGDPSNFSVAVPDDYLLSTSFPSNEIIFASKSGEIVGFVEGKNVIALTDTTTGKQKTLQLNKYGAVVSIN